MDLLLVGYVIVVGDDEICVSVIWFDLVFEYYGLIYCVG